MESYIGMKIIVKDDTNKGNEIFYLEQREEGAGMDKGQG